jgi:hypothetical protein
VNADGMNILSQPFDHHEGKEEKKQNKEKPLRTLETQHYGASDTGPHLRTSFFAREE